LQHKKSQKKKRYWAYENSDQKRYMPIIVKNPLPSDSRFREDVAAMVAGDLDQATEWKLKLEEKQRAEAKLRAEGQAILNEISKDEPDMFLKSDLDEGDDTASTESCDLTGKGRKKKKKKNPKKKSTN